MVQMVYYVMMALVYVLVRPMLLVTNVPNVQQDIGTFLHVKVNKNIPTKTKMFYSSPSLIFLKIVPVIRMGLLTVLVIPQVGSVHVLIMLVGINVMLVQLDGMVSQAVKVREIIVFNTYLVNYFHNL